MAEKTFLVKKGWLIAKDSFGNMLPFFLHVRDKDIVWQFSHKEFIKDVMKGRDIRDIEEINPTQILRFSSGIWSVDVNSLSRLCTIRTDIQLSSNIFTFGNNRRELASELTLPLTFIDNRNYHVQVTLMSESDILMKSYVLINKLSDESNNTIQHLDLKVKNDYEFADIRSNKEEYINTHIFIEITASYTDY